MTGWFSIWFFIIFAFGFIIAVALCEWRADVRRRRAWKKSVESLNPRRANARKGNENAKRSQ